MTIEKILLVDDDTLIRNFLAEVLRRKNKKVKVATNGEEGLELLQKDSFDLLITDMKMPKMHGLALLQKAKEIDPSLIVLFMTAYGSIENAVEAMHKGAFHYLIKPFSVDAFETILEKVEQQSDLLFENKKLKKEVEEARDSKHPQIIAESSFMKNLLSDLTPIAQSSASVFISGESGTGKEVVAQTIHSLSKRSGQPFITVNCPAIPETLLESEFFGHEKGAFTGATQRKLGRFELANKGSLLLDEVTEIPVSLQAKLLRAIQEQSFERVGSEHSIHVDVRIISTSNRDMKEAIEKKILREDLFYRLNVIPIHLAPLRERKEDILPLARYFLDRFCRENHKPSITLSQKAEEKLLQYNWPGNVRELRNIMERAVVLDQKKRIEPKDLFLSLLQTAHKKEEILSLDEMEKRSILAALEKFGSKTKAAEKLGITLRTLHNKLRKYQLSI